MNDVRAAIHQEITISPGIHFNELVRRLDLAPGQVQYHLKRLTASELIIQDPVWGRTHYFPKETNSKDRRAIAVLRRETANAILSLVLAEEEIRPEQVAVRFGLARSTVSYHLDRLEEVGLVEKGYYLDGSGRVTVPSPEWARELLHVTDPDMMDRLTDRFDRLVDGLLDSRY